MSESGSEKSEYDTESFEEEVPDEGEGEFVEDDAEPQTQDEDFEKQNSVMKVNVSKREGYVETVEEIQENETSFEFEVSSNEPSSFNSDDHAFHLDFVQQQQQQRKKVEALSKNKPGANGNRKSFSFSNERMREIERHNRILLQKILTQKPTYESACTKRSITSISSRGSTDLAPRVSSAAVNRKKQQQVIDRENQILKRKIEAISRRRPRLVS